MTRKVSKLGWVPDLPDFRDHMYAAPHGIVSALPPKVDLRPQCPPVLQQDQLGSCTSQAIANAHLFEQMKQKDKKPFLPSRLFIYYNERVMENTVKTDSGAMIRDGIKSVAQLGACRETSWPYVISKFTRKPTKPCFKSALRYQALSYQRLTPTLTELQGCLASGFPFVFGFSVYESFVSQQVADTGVVPMPSHSEQNIGGHAVLACGYDNATGRFLVMNSWGTDWGQQGYFTIPYAYLTNNNLADDFWTIKLVEN